MNKQQYKKLSGSARQYFRQQYLSDHISQCNAAASELSVSIWSIAGTADKLKEKRIPETYNLIKQNFNDEGVCYV